VQLFGAGGKLESDIAYSDWQPVTPAAPAAGAASAPAAASASAPAMGADQPIFPRDIHIWRPQDDYKLEIKILKLTLNEPITPERFELNQPAGTDLVHVGEETSGASR